MNHLDDGQKSELMGLMAQRELELQEAMDRIRGVLAEPIDERGPEVRDPGEQGAQAQERLQELARLDRYEGETQEIDAARQRMQQGTYGVCQVCGEEIPFERLRMLPTARFCSVHEAERERAQALGR